MPRIRGGAMVVATMPATAAAFAVDWTVGVGAGFAPD